MEQQNRVVPGTGWVSSWVVACMVLGILLSLTATASASRTLRASERSDIVRSTHVKAANGRRISDSAWHRRAPVHCRPSLGGVLLLEHSLLRSPVRRCLR